MRCDDIERFSDNLGPGLEAVRPSTREVGLTSGLLEDTKTCDQELPQRNVNTYNATAEVIAKDLELAPIPTVEPRNPDIVILDVPGHVFRFHNTTPAKRRRFVRVFQRYLCVPLKDTESVLTA